MCYKKVMSQQVRNWCFTSFNLDFDPQATQAIYGIYQREVCPDTGKEHLQGYLEFKQPTRLSKLKKFDSQVHWESRKGTRDQARDYCRKEDTRKPDTDPIEFGEWRKAGKRNDIHDMAADIKDNGLKFTQVCEAYPDLVIKYHKGIHALIQGLQTAYKPEALRGYWIYGAPGVGKSRYVHENYPELYTKAQNKWFDGYEGQSVILLDDFDQQGKCLSHYLKKWTDRYPVTGEVKGGTVNLRHDMFIITSNYTIQQLFSEDPPLAAALNRRFKVIEMTPDQPLLKM